MAGKLADAVSVKDFGAVGDGVADDAPAFAAALAAHRSLFVPAGRYRLATALDVLPGRTILGAGRDDTEILAQAANAFVFRRNEGAFAVEPGGTDDWNRSMLGNLTIRMAMGGRVWGHEFRERRQFLRRAASGWCVDLVIPTMRRREDQWRLWRRGLSACSPAGFASGRPARVNYATSPSPRSRSAGSATPSAFS